MPDSADHAAAQTQWKNYTKSSKKAQLPLDLSIQSFLLYQLRFVLAADLCSAWVGFGGLGAQLSHLSIVLNLAVIETVGIALSYHNVLSTRLTERARQRSTAEAEFVAQLSSEQFDVREQARREVANVKNPPKLKDTSPPNEQPKRKPYNKPKSPKRLPSRSPKRKRSQNRNRPRTPPRKKQAQQKRNARGQTPRRRSGLPPHHHHRHLCVAFRRNN